MNDETRTRRSKVMTPEAVRKIVMEVLDSRKSEIDELVARAARSAVAETLTALGVSTGNPIEAQETFASLRGLVKIFSDKDFQADLAHLRTWRRSVDTVKSKGLSLLTAAVVTGLLAWVVTGFKVSITR